MLILSKVVQLINIDSKLIWGEGTSLRQFNGSLDIVWTLNVLKLCEANLYLSH